MTQPYLETQAASGADTPYLVHLLFDEAVPVDRAALIAALEARVGRVVPIEAADESLHFALPEYPSRYGDSSVPMQLAVLALEGIAVDELGAALRQSWTWPDAGEVAAHCRASLSLADFFGAGVHRRIRLALFHAAATALTELLPVRALQWMPSQQVIAPQAYLASVRAGEGLRGSAVNVRRFRLGSGAMEQVLDTVGLRAFGLPELQLRHSGENRPRAEDHLYAQAAALFEQGEAVLLERGAVETVSAAPPERRVLQLVAP